MFRQKVRNVSIVSLYHTGSYFGSSLQSHQSCKVQSPFILVCSVEGGDSPLSVINYSQNNHFCCTISVVEVRVRLENLMIEIFYLVSFSQYNYAAYFSAIMQHMRHVCHMSHVLHLGRTTPAVCLSAPLARVFFNAAVFYS